MAAAPSPDQAAPARRPAAIRDQTVVLRRVPWKVYEALRNETSNDRIRMSYLDGTLTLMSPGIIHDDGIELLVLVVRGASAGMGLPLKGTRTATLRKGTARLKGGGKEPDQGFYIGDHVRALGRFKDLGRDHLDLNIDRPPDFAIEIGSSRKVNLGLPIYARLGVPEVWCHDVKTGKLRFFRLAGDAYAEVERSVLLPKLTTALVLQALDLIDEVDGDECAFLERVMQWTIDLPDPPAPA